MNIKLNIEKPISYRLNFKKGKIIKIIDIKTAKVFFVWNKYYPKYKRYAKTKKKILVHVPKNIPVILGDEVLYASCRKLSTLKSNIIVKKI